MTSGKSDALSRGEYFEGSSEAARLIDDIRGFIARDLEPLARQLGTEHEHGADRETLGTVWRMAHEAGFYGITLPVAMGGRELSVVDHLLVKEAIYASGSPFAPHILGELSGPPRLGALVRSATPYHLEHYIRPVAQACKSVCFAITEAQAGSDAGALQTQARRDGDHYVLDGRKRFISGSPFADCAVILASTAEAGSAQREVTAFFVDLDGPGARVEANYKTMAGQSSTGDIVLEGCRVPVENRIGEPGRGLALALGRINVNRLLHCAGMLGLARLCLDDSLRYAGERHQFGRPIAAFQAIQHMLADMATDLAAARGLMLATARALDAGHPSRAQASMSKLFCSEAAFRIADRAVQVHGGEGIVQGRRVEFLFRLLRMYRVLTGTSEIQRNTIARELLTPEQPRPA